MPSPSRAERRGPLSRRPTASGAPLPVGLARVQRSLAAVAVVVFVLTVAAIIILAIIRPMYPTLQSFGADPLRQFIAVFPIVGIAATLLSLVSLFTVTAIRRSRAQR